MVSMVVASTAIPPLSLHDALPIYVRVMRNMLINSASHPMSTQPSGGGPIYFIRNIAFHAPGGSTRGRRSEEHTSALQSPCKLVCRLQLDKKKRRETTSRNRRIVKA